MKHSITGIHCILELYDCPFELLDDEQFVRDAIKKTAGRTSLNLLTLTSHKFNPQGVTAIALLAESHLSIHTWPEAGYAGTDIFTCGQLAAPHYACEIMVDLFQARGQKIEILKRGTGLDYSPAVAFHSHNGNFSSNPAGEVQNRF